MLVSLLLVNPFTPPPPPGIFSTVGDTRARLTSVGECELFEGVGRDRALSPPTPAASVSQYDAEAFGQRPPLLMESKRSIFQRVRSTPGLAPDPSNLSRKEARIQRGHLRVDVEWSKRKP